VRLHLTQNYNGQLTHQDGIQALWASRIPELFSDQYNYNVGPARYIENPLNENLKTCRTSFKCVDSVLLFERRLNSIFPPDEKYEMVKHHSKKVMAYSVAYTRAYNTALKGMVTRRRRSAILEVGSFWFPAWVDAGQPDLNKLIKQPLSMNETRKTKREAILYKSGKMFTLRKKYDKEESICS
jgi:hypothetical protein